MINYKDLKLPILSKGSHKIGSRNMCIMEAIAYIERLPHSDEPECTSPVVARFCQGINDYIPDERRNELWQFAVRIAGTASPKHDQERAEFLAMAAVTRIAVMACEGLIDPKLVDAMREAKTLEAASSAALDATFAAFASSATDAARFASAASSVASYSADAARVASYSAADAAACAASAAHAARADSAAHAARAIANAAADSNAVWDCALEILDELLDIGNPKPISWDKVAQVDWSEFMETTGDNQ